MDDQDQARTLLRRAQAALEVHRPELAAAEATRALGLDPGSAQGHHLLGSALLRLDRYSEALEAVDVGLVQCPEVPRLHYLRSVILFNLGLYLEALQAADDALALDPELADAHGARGFALSALERKAEALEAVATAMTLEPEEAGHHRKYSEEQMQADPVLAERHARAALALAPEDVMALTLLGAALIRQRRDDEAYDVWQDAVRVDPTDTLVKAALLHHLNRDLKMGGLLPLIRTTTFTAQAALPAEEAGLGKKLLVLVPLLGLMGAARGLVGLAALGAPLREARLKRRAPALYALYLRLREDAEGSREDPP